MCTTLRIETAVGDFELNTAFDTDMGDYIEVKELFSNKVIGHIGYQDLEDLEPEQLETLEEKVVGLFDEAF